MEFKHSESKPQTSQASRCKEDQHHLSHGKEGPNVQRNPLEKCSPDGNTDPSSSGLGKDSTDERKALRQKSGSEPTKYTETSERAVAASTKGTAPSSSVRSKELPEHFKLTFEVQKRSLDFFEPKTQFHMWLVIYFKNNDNTHCCRLQNSSSNNHSELILLDVDVPAEVIQNQKYFFFKVSIVKGSEKPGSKNILGETDEKNINREDALNNATYVPIEFRNLLKKHQKSPKKSADLSSKRSIDTTENDQAIQKIASSEAACKEEKNAGTLLDIINNKTIEEYPQSNDSYVELNAIIGPEITSLGFESLTFGVCSSETNFKDLTAAYKMAEVNGFLWMKIFLRIKDTSTKVAYKYVLALKMKEDCKFIWEQMHKAEIINRVMYRSDFNGKCTGFIRYDGVVSFEQKNIKKGYWMVDILRDQVQYLKDFVQKTSPELDYYVAQIYGGFALYLTHILHRFITFGDAQELFENWRSILDSLVTIRWQIEGSLPVERKLVFENLNAFALTHFCSVYDKKYKPGVGDPRVEETVLFKLAVVLIICASERFWTDFDHKSLNKLLSLVCFSDCLEPQFLTSSLRASKINLNTLCSDLRSCCQKLLARNVCTFLKHPLFFALIDWAFLDSSKAFLVFPSTVCINESTFRNSKPYCTKPASAKHLILMGTFSRLSSEVMSEKWTLRLQDLFYCLMEYCGKRESLPTVLLQMIERETFATEIPIDAIEEIFDTIQNILSLVLGFSPCQLHDSLSVKRLLLISLDFLALFDKNLTGKVSEVNKTFYSSCEELIIKMNADRAAVFEQDLYFWAGLLFQRKNYKPASRDFVETQLKPHFMSLIRASNYFRIAEYSSRLPQIVDELRSKAYHIESFEDLQMILDEAFLESLSKIVDGKYNVDSDLICKIESRPRVKEAFFKVVSEKFPVLDDAVSPFEALKKILDYSPISVISELAFRDIKSSIDSLKRIKRRVFEVCHEIFASIQQGSLTPKQFTTILDKREIFADVCAKVEIMERNDTKSVLKKTSDILLTVQQKISDIEKLLELVKKFQSVGIKTEVSTLTEFCQNWKMMLLNELVDYKNSFEFLGKSVDAQDLSFVEKFNGLLQSRIFTRLAEENIKKRFDDSKTIAFSYQELLQSKLPQIENMYMNQAASVVSGKLAVGEAKQLFNDYNDEVLIYSELDYFVNFLSKHMGTEFAIQNEEIDLRKKQLKQMGSLDRNVRFITALKSLTQVLNTGTSFDQLGNLSRLENLDQIRLCDLTKELLECNSNLSNATNTQIEALSIFAKHPAFLQWIKEKVKTSRELTVVAELASLSAGEDPLEVNRVKCFHDAVFGYAPLIYDLKCESSFENLQNACQEVFCNLSIDPGLPKKYEDSARNQTWFEKALETQGSVEKSSLKKALWINESGIYSIGYNSTKGKTLITAEDVINLRFTEPLGSSGDFEQRSLSLTELRDLLSRLMLILGREKYEHVQNVNRFIATFQNVERLAGALVTLYNSGCSFFLNWWCHIRNNPAEHEAALEVHFAGKTLRPLLAAGMEVNLDLSDLCTTLESITTKWRDYVFEMRVKHPVLNRFNIQQLKTMSLSLAETKTFQQQVGQETLYILRTLNKNMCPSHVQKWLLSTDTELDELYSEEVPEMLGNRFSNLEKLADKVCVDKRTELISLIETIKGSGMVGDDKLAKAALQATGCEGEYEAINWIMEHEDEEETIECLAQQFDEYLASLCSMQPSNDDSSDIKAREFASNLGTIFDGFLQSLNDDILPDFINLDQLARFLKKCLHKEESENLFPKHFKKGEPNLIVCGKRLDILRQIISLYRFASKNSLPNYCQVLLCSERTTKEELEVFFLGAALDPECRVYSIAFADDMSASCAEHFEKLIFDKKLLEVKQNYKLAVFSCDENSQTSVLLKKYKSQIACEEDAILRSYLGDNLRTDANKVDEYKARLVTSSQPSSGKSLHIDRMADKMDENSCHYVLRLVDRKIEFEKSIDFLWKLKDLGDRPMIFHFDISSNVQFGVEEFIFKLCVLGGLRDERGKQIIAENNVLIAIEMLQPQKNAPWESICQLLPTSQCLSPNQCLNRQIEKLDTGNKFVAADEKLISANTFQRPYQYLTRLQRNENITNYTYTNDKPADADKVIQTLKHWSTLTNPTWGQLSGFARFLDEQLNGCEKNIFANSVELTGFKYFLIKHCLIQMARDFALPSLKISDDSPLFGLEENQTNYEVHQIRRSWENDPHHYVFFNADGSTFTFLGVQVHNTHLLDAKGKVIANDVMSRELEQQIRRQAYDEPNILGENFDALREDQKFTKLCRVLGVDDLKGQNVDCNYELTQDNVMKLLAIHMRFRCDIPVIIMGETGCGKTRLIEYLCLLMAKGENVVNKKIVKVHGGVTVQDIFRNVEEAESIAKDNTHKFGQNFYTVLFFDEANTTEAIYAIKEVVCDFSVNGRKLDRNSGLKVIVACNPYKKHDEKMIKKLETQGLGYFVKSSETEDKLDSDIPMRHLVYRVNALPPSLLPLVWDFGQLKSDIEDKYIKQIVVKRTKKLGFGMNQNDVKFICEVLSISQRFLRNHRDQCLFVSLRDIERVMTVLEFFHSMGKQLLEWMDQLKKTPESKGNVVNELARLVILSLGVCYHSSLEDREQYRKAISKAFAGDYAIPNGPKSILREIELCQQVFVGNLHLDKKANIAANLALNENVFMMIVCIQLRIPLFLVGKPGSSKSLAKTIVVDAMQGVNSANEFFKRLKRVQMLSFQCSPHTNADGIVSIFKQASLYQEGKDLKTFVSVVVLDEVGLAEDSPKMPLKTLHPLLEEGYVETGKYRCDFGKVSFVGISNWALDPAKMNRGILVSRSVPTSEELVRSARGICRVNEVGGQHLEKLISPLSAAYEEIYRAQNCNEYFGLRDFYGLMKKLHQEFIRNGKKSLDWDTVENAIRRNFGEKENKAYLVFREHLETLYEECRALSKDVDILRLVQENINEANKRAELTEEQRSMDNESRYLLLMTENFSALQLLPQVLNLSNCEIIFGSSFPQDQEYIQVCRNINRIKVCMEMGTTVVLLNLGSLYESLYDALNQYYVYYGDKRYVDLGLGSNRVKCNVSQNFRLIVIEEEKIARNFPIPLLNRLEKHFLGMETILTPFLMKVRNKVCRSVAKFSKMPRKDVSENFKIHDAFVGYQNDTTACVVMQAKNLAECQKIEPDEATVYLISLEKIFQTCTREAIFRARSNLSEIENEVIEGLICSYEQQGRKNFGEFLSKHIYSNDETTSHLIEVTTFNRLPSHHDIKQINRDLMKINGLNVTDERHAIINLNMFQTEHEFLEHVKIFIRRSKQHEMKKILFITCAGGDRCVSLIACAMYSLQNFHKEVDDSELYIVFVVQLSRQWYKANFSSFSVGEWASFHVDMLIVEEEIESLREATESQGSTARDLFVLSSNQCSKLQRRLLRDVIHEAVADSDGPDKLLRVSNVFQVFSEQYTCTEGAPNLEVLFLQKAATFMGSEGDKELQQWMADKSSNLQDLILHGNAENSLLQELKERLKPRMVDFLNTIDFNSNIRLLFENSWRKLTWMRLFSLKEIARSRMFNTKKNTFDCIFPFSAEIIARMEKMWIEAQENCADHAMESPTDYFIHCFHNRPDDVWATLRDLSFEESALDAFIHDLVHDSIGSTHKLNRGENKFIRKSIVSRMTTINQCSSLARAFAVFKNFQPEIAASAPALGLISLKSAVPPDTTFYEFVLKGALERVSEHANSLTCTRSDINKFFHDMKLLKVSSSQSLVQDSTFDVKLQKLCVLSTFLEEICYGLDEKLIEQASAGAKILWTSILKEQDICGSRKFFERVNFSLNKSSSAVIKYFLEKEGNRYDCALCKKDVTGKGFVPYVIPCPKSHVVHEECWSAKMKVLSSYGEENLLELDVWKCLHCNEDISRKAFNSAKAREFKCKKLNSIVQWNQFQENICKVFINLVHDHFMKNCAPDVAKDIVQICLFFNQDWQRKWSRYYITNQSKQALITIFAQKNPDLLNKVLNQLVLDDIDTGVPQINCSKTLNLLIAAFDCVISNHGLLEFSPESPKFVQNIHTMLRVKIEMRNFCREIVDQLNMDRRITLTIPRSIQNVLRKDKTICDHLKKLFVRTICLDHGMKYYAKIKESRVLQTLLPEILVNSQSGDFTDIFLVIPGYDYKLKEFLTNMISNSKAAYNNLQREEPLMKNLIIYRLLLDFGKNEVPNEGLRSLLEALQDQTLGALDMIVNRTHRMSPHNHVKQALSQHFFFLLQAIFTLQESAGILEPFKNIALNGVNVNQLYLPTFPDSAQRTLNLIDRAVADFRTWNRCPNGHNYMIGDCGQPVAAGFCPDCRAPVGGAGDYRYNPNNELLGNRGTVVLRDTKATGYIEGVVNLSNFERQIDGLSGNVMQFFLHATMYLESGSEEMAEKAQQNVITLSRNILNSSEDDTWKLLVDILIRTSNQPLQGSFLSEDEREEWEKTFSTHVVNQHKNIDRTLQLYEVSFRNDCRNEKRTLPIVIYGTPFEQLPTPTDFRQDLMSFEKFWIRPPNFSLSTFETQILSDKERYPFLSALLDKEVVESLKHIPTLLHLFKGIVNYFNVEEAHGINTVNDFLQSLPDDVCEDLDQRIRVYIKIWNALIRHRLDSYPVIKCLFRDPLTLESHMKYFLPTRHENDCAALVTMNFLISKNNELVEKYRLSCKIETAVFYLEEGLVREDNVVNVSDLKRELLSTIVAFTTQDFDSNSMRVVHDFAAIERTVGSRYCSFKPLIKMKVMPLMSKSPSTRIALNNARVLLQEKLLTPTEMERIQRSFNEIPDVCKALRQLIMLMKYLDKDCCKGDETIADFMKKALKLDCMPAIGSYHLNQTVSLWQHLALKKTCLMIEQSDEDPFPEILTEFKEELEVEQGKELCKMKTDLRRKLLILLNEFIVLNLQEPDLMKPDYHIETDCLNVYFDEETGLNLPEWVHLKYATDVVRILAEKDPQSKY